MKIFFFICFFNIFLYEGFTQNLRMKDLDKMEKQLNRIQENFTVLESSLNKYLDSSKYLQRLDSLEKKGKKYSAELDTLNTFFKYLSDRNLIQPINLNVTHEYLNKLTTYRQLLGEGNFKKSIDPRQLKKLYQQAGVLENKFGSMAGLKDKVFKKLLKNTGRYSDFTSFFNANSEYSQLFSNPWLSDAVSSGNLRSSYQSLESVQGQFNNLIPRNLDLSAVNHQVQEKMKELFNQVLPGDQQETLKVPDSLPSLGKKLKDQLEYSFNLQSQRSTAYWPMTSDVAANIGYRFTKNSVIGVGVSGKIGWGHSIQHIRITQQGFSICSFLDYPLKGSFYVSGGFELNRQQVTDSLNSTAKPELPYFSQSGLVGITKIVSVQHQFFKKTKVQLLWDFLSYAQRPPTPAFKFRIGYTL